MGYGSISGRARTNPNRPESFGVCDRCGIWHNLNRLNWQYEYSGTQLQNINYLFCKPCIDVPQPQLKARIIPPDPVPVLNARPENFLIDEA